MTAIGLLLSYGTTLFKTGLPLAAELGVVPWDWGSTGLFVANALLFLCDISYRIRKLNEL